MNKEQALAELKKEFGDKSIMLLSEHPTFEGRVVSSGSIGLNLALGIGGYPGGRMVEIYGPESSGKSTLAQEAVAEAQKKGGLCGYVDAEHSLDVDYAKNLGVNIDDLVISQPDNGEQALNIVRKMLSTNAFSVVVVDSVSALVPQAELEGAIGDQKMGLQARLMSQGLRMLNNEIKGKDTVLIFINQLRLKIGMMFGNPETTSGGESLKYYASVRLDIRRKTINKDGEDAVSNTVKVKVVKNKVAPPFRSAEFDIKYGEGIDKFSEIVAMSIDLGIVKKGGAWLTYEGNKFQGDTKFKEMLKDNPEVFEQLEQQVKAKL